MSNGGRFQTSLASAATNKAQFMSLSLGIHSRIMMWIHHT
jgi:hypothetical protein